MTKKNATASDRVTSKDIENPMNIKICWDMKTKVLMKGEATKQGTFKVLKYVIDDMSQ